MIRMLRRLVIVFVFARSKDVLFKTKIPDKRHASNFYPLIPHQLVKMWIQPIFSLASKQQFLALCKSLRFK